MINKGNGKNNRHLEREGVKIEKYKYNKPYKIIAKKKIKNINK